MNKYSWLTAVKVVGEIAIDMYSVLFDIDKKTINPPDFISDFYEITKDWSFLAPIIRTGDKELYNLFRKRFSRDSKPKVLEVGAGISYCPSRERVEDKFDFNSPWLARLLKVQFPSIEITATDLQPTCPYPRLNEVNYSYVYFFVGPNEKLFSKRFVAPADFPVSEIRYYDDEIIGLTCMDFDEIEVYFQTIEARRKCNLIKKYGRIRQALEYSYLRPWQRLEYRPREEYSEAYLRYGKHFIRPIVDPEIENFFFNLNFKGGADLCKIDNHFEPNSFDLIYLRHFADRLYLVYRHRNKIATIMRPGAELRLLGDCKNDVNQEAQYYCAEVCFAN